MGSKLLSKEEFVDAGYLQETNRLTLHPAGMALAVHTGWDAEFIQEWLAERGVRFGTDACEAILTFIHRYEAEGFLAQVWDEREDPDGIGVYFKDLSDADSIRKADSYSDLRARLVPTRVKALGSNVQRIGTSFDFEDS